jgi:DNA ligase-1
MNKKLYSLDSKGLIREWEVFVEGNTFYTVTGLQDGAKVKSEPKECFGKNTGKANETTNEEQALLEAESAYNHKKKTKYYDTIEEAKADEDFFRVMLADKWEKRKDKLTYPIIHQAKLDGIRCIITAYGARTRGNTPINVIPHILDELKPFFDVFPDAILDGELYNHDLKDDFQKLISIVRKDKATPENLKASKEYMQFHCYDCPHLSNLVTKDVKYSDRFDSMVSAVTNCIPKLTYTKFVDHIFCLGEEDADLQHEKAIQLGYEGSIYRVNGTYENKRSKGLLKRKDFTDEEATVVDIQSGKGNWSGYAKIITLELNGKQFNSGVRGTQSFLKDVLDNKNDYIGKSATLRYFRLTDDGIPYLPVVINFAREDYENVKK